MSKIDHLPIVRALRKMEQYQEKHFPVESLDATLSEWQEIVEYIEGREFKLAIARQMGMVSPQEAAKNLVGLIQSGPETRHS